MENTDKISQMAAELGKRGGTKTRDNLGKKHYRDMAKKSAEIRRKKKLSTPDTCQD